MARISNRNYEGYISGLMTLSSVALSIYSTLIRIDDEMEYVWLKPFTFPTLLYLLGRYTSIITQGFAFIGIYITTHSSCNILINVSNVIFVLNYIGYIGLIVARAYSLCGNKLNIVLLMLGFGTGLFIIVFKAIVFTGCFVVRSEEEILMTLVFNLALLVTDFLAFGISLYKVWDTWNLKRKAGIQTGNDLVSTLLKQIISRFS